MLQTTFGFTLLTIVTALNAGLFGGVFGLIISWFAALLGPIAIPMILGLLPAFHKSNGTIALISIVGGLSSFFVLKWVAINSFALEVGGPTLVSLVIYIFAGFISTKEVPQHVKELHTNLDKNH